MAYYFSQESRTFSEYLLVPNLTGKEYVPDHVQLDTPLVRYRKGEEESRLTINLPVVSAIMQAVSDDGMAIALSRLGGLSFVYSSQPIESQVDMISRVKKYKAGVVKSDSNLMPDNTLTDLLRLKERTGHSTVAVTDDGSPNGLLLGIITSKDYRITRT
ncbi:MAG TPA: IMP dehydrogenase, partial [Clostridia bacterium]